MLFGLPFHAALAFSGNAWLVTNDQGRSVGLVLLLEFIRLWRMPAFFVVAGFFALSLARRRGVGPWYASRLVRLGLPCLFGLAIINPLQLAMMGVLDAGTPLQIFQRWLSSYDKVLHMWFLIDLMVYCGVLAILLAHPSVSG
jgi:glucan biosynthesis protein C